MTGINNIPVIILTISFLANFFSFSEVWAENLFGYSVFILLPYLFNKEMDIPNKSAVICLMIMNVLQIICVVYNLNYKYYYEIIIISVIFTISLIRLEYFIKK